MGLCLANTLLLAQAELLAQFQLLAVSLDDFGGYVVGGLQAAIGLGLVIFVHELGHFAVAKWCGVQCDKFMVGFDIGGYKIGRQWGDTYYGIGILPLGGYVKMMGQDDDPSKFAEQARESQAMADDPNAKEITGPGGERVLVDRRSYMAKSVPQRMAIISAGVIMNVITGFLFAFIAFGMGVPREPAVTASTAPAGAAWEANLRTGDRLTRINDTKNPTFEMLMNAVLLGNLDRGMSVDVAHADGDLTTGLQLVPKKVGALPQVGFARIPSLRLREKPNFNEHSPAGQAAEGFQGDDLIVAVNGTPVSNYAEFFTAQLPLKSDPIAYTVLRGGKPSKADPNQLEGGEQVTFTIDANPRERMGIVPVLGPVVAIQKDSPAESAGVQVGDQLVAINGVYLGAAPNGEPTWDPVDLDDRLAELAASGETATLTLQRIGESAPIDVSIPPRPVNWDERPRSDGPIAFPSLGVACPLQAEVAAIVDGSPAQSVDLLPGDQLLDARLLEDGQPLKGPDGAPMLTKPIVFSEEKLNWPVLLMLIQDNPPETKVELTVARGDKQHKVEVGLAADPNAFSFPRGIPLTLFKETRVATSFSEQATMAWSSTYQSLTQVLRFLSKIGNQVPVGALGGPITIVKAGFASTDDGVASLLLFLTMLSANLAVLNFLPIPVLDGGHMVFLAYEGLRGRPANEKFVMIMQMCGMVFLLGLMAFVFGLDLGLIDRGL